MSSKPSSLGGPGGPPGEPPPGCLPAEELLDEDGSEGESSGDSPASEDRSSPSMSISAKSIPPAVAAAELDTVGALAIELDEGSGRVVEQGLAPLVEDSLGK